MSIVEMYVRKRTKREQEAFDMGRELGRREATRYGRWVWDVETHGDPMYGVDEDFGYRCSECKVWADEYGVDGDIYEEPPTHILRYCPNCGCKMDVTDINVGNKDGGADNG